MMKHLGILLLACLLPRLAAANAAQSDYAWVPDYKKLYLKAGADLMTSASNFDNTGSLVNLTGGTELSRKFFFIEPEYGLAQNWSMKMKVGLISSGVANASGASTLSSSGFGDMSASLKWMLRDLDPLFTFEGVFVLPTAASTAKTANDVALGDGAFGAGAKLNTLHQAGAIALGFSPGFLYRSRGYSPLITGDAFFQFDFRRGYIRGYGSIVFPLMIEPGRDSSLTKHDAAGAAGSYALLSNSPFGVSAGGKLGIKIVSELYVEGWFTRSFVGQRYANFNQFGFGLFYAIDFLENLPVKQVRDVPFDADDSTFYKGK